MKKEYKTPAMKVRTIQFSHMLCISDINFGNSFNSGNNDYIGGGSGSGYGYGVPD